MLRDAALHGWLHGDSGGHAGLAGTGWRFHGRVAGPASPQHARLRITPGPGNPRAAYAGPGSISGFLYGTFTTACIKVCVQVAGKPPLMGFIRIGALSRMCGIGPAGCSIAAAVPPIMRRVPCLAYYGPTWGRELRVGRTYGPTGTWGRAVGQSAPPGAVLPRGG